MAVEQQVKHYLAYWFLLGKKVLIPRSQSAICPRWVFEGERYSSEFEHCWQIITDTPNHDSYLEGTDQTIQDLLSEKWEIIDCAKCQMPIPMITLGIQGTGCPCCDLEGWPNTELPKPKAPTNSQSHLHRIREKLNRLSTEVKDKGTS